MTIIYLRLIPVFLLTHTGIQSIHTGTKKTGFRRLLFHSNNQTLALSTLDS